MPIAYLLCLGYCYVCIIAIERVYRQLSRYQQKLLLVERLITVRAIVQAKLKTSRVLLRRQRRRIDSPSLEQVLQTLDDLASQAAVTESCDSPCSPSIRLNRRIPRPHR